MITVDMLGNRLKTLIKSQNTKIEAIAELSGVSIRTIQGWTAQSKARVPRADHLYKVAQSLGTTVGYLLTGVSEEQIQDEWILENMVFINQCKQLSNGSLKMIKNLVQVQLNQEQSDIEDVQREAR